MEKLELNEVRKPRRAGLREENECSRNVGDLRTTPAACKGRSYMWLKFREEESTRRKSRKVRENWARGDLIGDMGELQLLGKLVISVQLPKGTLEDFFENDLKREGEAVRGLQQGIMTYHLRLSLTLE